MDLATQERNLRIIHLALCLSLAIYGAIAYTVAIQQPPVELERTLVLVLIGMGVMTPPIIFVLRQKLLPPMAPPGSITDVPAGKLDDKQQQAAARYFSASILSWALCESIALYGLVLAFLSHLPGYYTPL